MIEATTSERVVLSGQGRDRAVLAIGGMTCGSCAKAVHRVLSRVPGVVSVEVDLAAGRALVQGSARPEDLLTAVEGAGYRAALGNDKVAATRPKGGGCGCGC